MQDHKWFKKGNTYTTRVSILQSCQCKLLPDGVNDFPFAESEKKYEADKLDRWEYEQDGVLFIVFND